MGTWTRITITGPSEDLERVKLDKIDAHWHEYLAEMSERFAPKTEGVEGWIALALDSKWQVEETSQWAIRFTRKRPTLTVTVRSEWDNRDADEPGFEEDVFRAGEWVPAESKVNGEVPSNLGNLLEMARFALTVNDPVPAREALTALIKGLE